MSDFMKAQADAVLESVRKLGNETREEQDAQDANLREITEEVAERYLCWFGGSQGGWYGSDRHWRVWNRHGKVIAKIR